MLPVGFMSIMEPYIYDAIAEVESELKFNEHIKILLSRKSINSNLERSKGASHGSSSNHCTSYSI